MRIGDEDNDQQEDKMRKIRGGGGGTMLCAGRLEVDADRVVDRFPRAVSVSCKRGL